MKLAELTTEINAFERDIAPGSESTLWGHFCDHFRSVADDTEIDENEARWWIAAYEAQAANPAAEDVREWFDAADTAIA